MLSPFLLVPPLALATSCAQHSTTMRPDAIKDVQAVWFVRDGGSRMVDYVDREGNQARIDLNYGPIFMNPQGNDGSYANPQYRDPDKLPDWSAERAALLTWLLREFGTREAVAKMAKQYYEDCRTEDDFDALKSRWSVRKLNAIGAHECIRGIDAVERLREKLRAERAQSRK